MYLTELQKSYDDFFSKLIDESKIFLITPTNLEEEKKLFFKTKNYNPVFEYNEMNEITRMYFNIIQNLSPLKNKSSVDKILNAKQREIKLKFKLSSSIGKDSFTNLSIRAYGKPSEHLIKEATKILKLPYKKTKRSFYSSDETISELKTKFKDLGIRKWKVIKTDLSNSASVNCETRQLKLKKRERMSKKFVERLKVHEIETHALRYENGRQQCFKILKYGFPNYISTEEGLAVYSEEKHGVLSKSILRNYAGRVLAIHFALQLSFDKTYKKLLKYFDKNTAFKLTVRAKRGLKDTSKPGAFTKDIIYLKGYLEVKKFAQNNNLTQLYVGKIGIKDISKVSKLNFVKDPKILPDFLKESNV